ncbi:MAG: RidA family protein, partial [Solirubrobacteraceae bacterium]
MAHEIITAPELAPPVGYAHAVRPAAGRLVFLGGQTALGSDGKIVGETLPEQLDVAAGNVLVALRAAGGVAEDIVSMQIFVRDVAEYRARLRELGEVWRRRFGAHYPAAGLFG